MCVLLFIVEVANIYIYIYIYSWWASSLSSDYDVKVMHEAEMGPN
jgi:Na+/glutamate symporter